MHRGANGVTDVLADDAKVGSQGDLLHGPADFIQAIANNHLLDASPERALRHVQETLGLFADLTDTGRVGRVAVIALDNGATVNRDDVTLLQNVLTGNTVNDHVVRTRADNGGKPVVPKKVRTGAALFDHGGRYFVEKGGRNTGTNRGSSLLVHLGDYFAGLAHLV